jgi:hypothetical protein
VGNIIWNFIICPLRRVRRLRSFAENVTPSGRYKGSFSMWWYCNNRLPNCVEINSSLCICIYRYNICKLIQLSYSSVCSNVRLENILNTVIITQIIMQAKLNTVIITQIIMQAKLFEMQICIPHRVLIGRSQQGELGRSCSTHRRDERRLQHFIQKILKTKRDQLGGFGVDGTKALKHI